MENSDEVNLKSRFFQVGESSRKDFTFKPFSPLCLELGDSCKLKQGAFVSPFMGNLTLKSTSNSVVINRHRTHRSLQLTSLELKDLFTPPVPDSAMLWVFLLLSLGLVPNSQPLRQSFLPRSFSSNVFLQCLPLMLIGYVLPSP